GCGDAGQRLLHPAALLRHPCLGHGAARPVGHVDLRAGSVRRPGQRAQPAGVAHVDPRSDRRLRGRPAHRRGAARGLREGPGSRRRLEPTGHKTPWTAVRSMTPPRPRVYRLGMIKKGLAVGLAGLSVAMTTPAQAGVDGGYQWAILKNECVKSGGSYGLGFLGIRAGNRKEGKLGVNYFKIRYERQYLTFNYSWRV